MEGRRLENEYLLEMKNITKEFPGVKALDNVQLKVRKGSVHALMGENGAGKSTLMKILIGIYKPEQGKVIFKGNVLEAANINESLQRGISMIHQELSPVPHMTAAENIFLGREPTVGKSAWVNQSELVEKTRKLFERLEINVDPKAKMKDLSIANMQMVEIAKAISYNADLIIMDEPTSAITDKEVAHLFKIIRALQKEGVAIIYISHKMDEIFEICDEITIFRDGQYVSTHFASELDNNRLIELMVGRELKEVFYKENAEIKDVFLSVQNLSKKEQFENVSFEVRRGEILGFAGLMGSGRTEVMESLFGIYPPDAGEIYIEGKKVTINSPEDAIKNRIGLLTEDRKQTGVFLPLSVQDNMLTVSINKYIKAGFLKQKKINEHCEEERRRLAIKTPNLQQKIKFLSGGNQQKALLARWLLNDPDLLILDEPTRGIDVGAKSEIHKLMCELAKRGKAIIMISSELPEVLGLSDRIVVMHEGKLTGELSREEATQEHVMQLATGKMLKKESVI
jgi:inositol transport system ATP-binding protein